jgi:Cyclin
MNSIAKKPLRNPNSKLIIPKKCEEEPVLLTLLKKYSLQQYYKNLSIKGYEHNLRGLVLLSDLELDSLLDSIKFFPGHRSKFISVINSLKRKNCVKDTSRTRSSSQRSSSKEKILRPGSCKNKYRKDNDRLNRLLDPNDICFKYTSESSRTDPAEELEKAYRKIKELELQLENLSVKPEKPLSFDPFEALPEIPVKSLELGVSYDSSKMRSTLHHLDIEEICKCLSKVIRKMILECTRSRKPSFSPSSAHSETTNYESINEDVPLSVLTLFNQQFYDPSLKSGVVPGEDEIYNISKNIIIRSKMEKECSIISLIYIDRLKKLTGIGPNDRNWKRLLFISLVLASKVWDDESYENHNFADVFSNISLKDLNNMEVTFLNLVDYKVGITKSEYARYYFLLRVYADKRDRSFPLVPLDVDTVRKLQTAASNAEAKLREIHEEHLYKTL